MSQMQPESTAPQGGGNVFTRKLGPLPMWAWMGIALALAIVYYLYKKHTSSSTSSQNSAQNSSVNTPGGVDASLVPQFVNPLEPLASLARLLLFACLQGSAGEGPAERFGKDLVEVGDEAQQLVV